MGIRGLRGGQERRGRIEVLGSIMDACMGR